MAKTNKKPTNFHALFFLQIFFRYSFVKRSLYRVKDVDSTRGQTVNVLWPLAISSLKELSYFQNLRTQDTPRFAGKSLETLMQVCMQAVTALPNVSVFL